MVNNMYTCYICNMCLHEANDNYIVGNATKRALAQQSASSARWRCSYYEKVNRLQTSRA